MHNDFSVNKLSFTLTLSLGRGWPSPISQFTATPASWDWVARDRGWRLPQQNGTPLPERNTSSVVSDGFHVSRWDMVWEVNAECIWDTFKVWPWIISRAALTFSETPPCNSFAADSSGTWARPYSLDRRRSPHHAAAGDHVCRWSDTDANTAQLHELTHRREVVSSWRRRVNCHTPLQEAPLKLSWVCLTVAARIYKHQRNISCFLWTPGWRKHLLKIRQKIKEPPPPPLFFFLLDT